MPVTRDREGRKTIRVKKRPACPHCGSRTVLPVVYGPPSPELAKAVRRGQAVLNSSLEWEGEPEWRCNACGCEWRGSWMRFKKN